MRDLQQRPPACVSRRTTGLIASGGVPVPGSEEAYRRFLELRREIYVDEAGFLAAEHGSDGRETDEDDARSLAFAVVEECAGELRIRAALRLIVKGRATRAVTDDRLPVERYWPEVFGSSPAPEPSVEVSRLIARHEDRAAQHASVLELYAAVLAFLDEAGIRSAYGLIDPVLERLLRLSLTATRIGERRWIGAYRSHNVAIVIEVPPIRRLSRWLPGSFLTARDILVGIDDEQELAA